MFKKILKQYWGYDGFRPMQEEIVKSIYDGNDTLGLLPTGGGKSITFQVPALAKEGICIVVTPLIALMKDQVENLKKRGIKAVAIHSGLTQRELMIALDNCIYGGYKFVYLSPERLSTPLFLEKLVHFNVNMLAIDEAHCISQWGYDFRPSYLKIADIRKELPDVPVLALTATATPEVVKDIQKQLNFKQENVFQKSFERKNLIYVVRKTEDKEKELLNILKSVDGSAVVYVRNRKKTKEYAEFLVKNEVSADYFHAGLSPKVKDLKQNNWMNNSCRVIVSTNAFGMGIDKPDVRVVVHLDAPDSLEAYFQEAGRAGRDEQTAYSVFLWSDVDKRQLNKSVSDNFPEIEVIRKVYDSLCNYFEVAVGYGENRVFNFSIGQFCKNFGYNVITVLSSLKILERAGYLQFAEESNMPSRLILLMNNFELNLFYDSNPSYTNLIKTILRGYTGLFVEYAVIDEDKIAQRLGVSRDEVYEKLVALSKFKVLHYIPAQNTPLITFLERRELSSDLVFTKQVYGDRLVQYRERVDSVIEYLTTSHICRSVLLLRYFGQTNNSYCGSCDVCISRKKSAIKKEDFNIIEEEIISNLKNKSLSTETIISKSEYPSNDVWEVLHWLEDVGKIQYNNKGDIELLKDK